MSEQRLRNLYLPPFKAAIDAGADTVMCSFNAINGVPGCANTHTETDILKRRVGLRRLHRERLHGGRGAARLPAEEAGQRPCGHGVAADGPTPRAQALNAGTDMEMVVDELPRLRQAAASRSGQISMTPDQRRGAPDPARQVPRRPVRPPVRRLGQGRRSAAPDARDRAAARKDAAALDGAAQERQQRRCRSTRASRSPLIGPLGDDQHDMLGPWWGRGATRTRCRCSRACRAQAPNVTYTAGLHDRRQGAADYTTRRTSAAPTAGFAAAVGRGQGGRPGRARARRDARA